MINYLLFSFFCAITSAYINTRNLIQILFYENQNLNFAISTIFYQIKVRTTHHKFYIIKNFNESDEKNHNPNCPYMPDHPYRIVISGGSGSDKTNVLLNLIKH